MCYLYRCFVGDDIEMTVEDCIVRDRKNPVTDPHETSRSVSEMKEWVCSKLDKPDGTIHRDCMRLYTGGDAFRVCYSSIRDGTTCLCSAELCNGSTSAMRQFSSPTCQNLVKYSVHLISCFILVTMFTSYHQTISKGQEQYVIKRAFKPHTNMRQRIS